VAHFRRFKFGVAFDNSDCDGALSEKVVNVALADAVPIVWGAPDIDRLLNMDAIVHCNVTYNAATDEGLVQAFIEKHTSNPQVWPEEAVQKLSVQRFAAAKAHLRALPGTAQCIAEVQRLDGDDAAFQRKVAQPLFTAADKGAFDLGRLGADIRRVMDARELSAAGYVCPGKSEDEREQEEHDRKHALESLAAN
jgi:hypothetical protein